MRMLEYTAIDFETANSYRGSPCSVGLVRVRNGVAVAEKHWLMRPPEGADWFAPWNVDIHGITSEIVATAPRWKDILPAIVDFIGDDVVVAHNAGFDIGVIRYACSVDNIEWPEMRFLCTLVMSRRALALPTYRLPYVAESLGFELREHHDALADARAVVDVVSGLAAESGAATLDELAASVGVRIGFMASGVYKGSVSTSGGVGPLVRPELNPDADVDGYLYGRVIVFTGKLMSMDRRIAWHECSGIGALAEENVTKRTNVLVVGDINPAVLRPGSEITGRARRAFELQDKGQPIEVMTEDDFIRCLDGKPLAGPDSILSESSDIPHTATQHRLRSVPIAERPAVPLEPLVKAIKPPKPLRRTRIPTDQTCSQEGCEERAGFKSRTKPTWCEAHIIEIQRQGGLRSIESFTHPDDWQMTECLICAVTAHYRFNYTLEKNAWGEHTCRACYWRKWAAGTRSLQGPWANVEPVSFDEAKAFAEEHGYDYLGPLTAPSYRDDPHHTKCRRCGKVSAERLSDIGFGCTCQPRT